MTTYTVDAPPPGTWLRFADHFPHALTPEYTRLYRATFEPAQAAVFERYGVPFAGLATAIIDGHLYLSPKSLIGRSGARLPPRPVLWLATRLHPEMRRRRARARAVLRDRVWRDEVHVWRRELRALWVGANLALQAIDPMSLDDGALAHHVRQCQANAEEGYRAHFLLHGPDFFATGLLLASGTDWGLDVRELLSLLVGSSPASTGADEDLDFVRDRVVEHFGGPETLRSLDDVRAVGPDVAAALDRFLLHHGWRLITSYDLDGRCLHELPELLLTLVTTPRPAPAADVDVEPLRQRVPADHRVELDRLLDDARFTYGLRDENGGITSAWTVGLLRRSMLEVGRRLAERGRLETAADAVELDVDELLGLLAGGVGPAPANVAARAAARASASGEPMPARFGPDLPGREVSAMFPAPLDLIVRSQVAIVEGISHPTDEVLSGLGIGDRAVTSRACVAHDAAGALARMRAGDVLVARSTTPAFNAALSVAGGLVVEEGGYLSHAAVTARELGLPAVIGATGALSALPDGELVCLEPDLGIVRRLNRAQVPGTM
jgi:pyruvate,water dikinase